MVRLAAEVAADRHAVIFADRKQLKNREPRAQRRVGDDVGRVLRVPDIVVVAQARLRTETPIAVRGVGYCAKSHDGRKRANARMKSHGRIMQRAPAFGTLIVP